MKHARLAMIGLLLLLVLSLSACSAWGGRNDNQYYNSERAKYFAGVDGVSARFEQVPPKLYYYGNAPDSAANDFPVGVEVRNTGSSYTRGAVFVSGYDPNLIMFDENPLETSYPGACSLRIGDFSLNQFGVTAQCGDSFFYSGHEDNWLDSITVRGKTWFDDTIFKNIILNYDRTQMGETFDVDFDGISFTARQHGLALISILAGLSFEKFFGKEYLLAADNYDYPGGEIDYVDYHGHIVNWPKGTDEIPQTLLLTSCYMYTTFAAPVVCIDPQPYSENRKVCSPKVSTWSNGQGAPVAITRVTQENTPRTAVFHIEVANRGGGTVYDAGSLEKCSPYFSGGVKANELNVLWIGDVRIGDYRLQCTPANYVRLRDGHAEFTCTYPIKYGELNSAYQTPLVIELWYGYSQAEEHHVMIKRVT